MRWSHDGDWLLSSDDVGVIKYWQPNMNNVKAFKAHSDAVRDLSFSPSDEKFVSACDDGVIKLWDFEKCVNERKFTGMISFRMHFRLCMYIQGVL